ncbi:MAG: NAD-dependent epimerase/dehydratase family protein [Thermomonas sp.]|uniref:NAD-dependent epimerase/dehydratase family protein n=1 Tax=Thermomonas sp. TaxID=1971895 RepID=UPI001D96101E|nr:NAD-dependent epimerase/dehydratase family protein [Thermomonas sp.]MBZ0087324.1 NAD-dependent epimerase/dehydratase family protein [Thermomonas sp.]
MQVLVTGGGGFLGLALCRALRERGHAVTSFSRSAHAALETMGVPQLRGDLADRTAVLRALDGGFDAVLHNAAKAGVWGRRADFHAANVLGTENVLAACRAHGIGKLVYTSTPSVTHRATRPVEGVGADEVPYGEPFKSHYAATKAIAERAVLAANDDRLATVALRPRLIWGPNDTQILPRLVARARSGRVRLVGGGDNLVDTTYLDNAAQAHADALEHLHAGADCAGQAYFISNGEPWPLRDVLNALLRAADAPEVRKSISFPAAYAIGAVCEALWTLLPLRDDPPLTRFLAEQLSTPHWYSMAPATRDFGYRPRLTMAQGLARLRASLHAG